MGSITQVTNSYSVKNFLFAPYCDGIDRVSRCFQGIDTTQIDHPKLSLQDRAISLLTGLLLLIPLLNLIFWQFLKNVIPETPIQPWAEAIAAAAPHTQPIRVPFEGAIQRPVSDHYRVEEHRKGIEPFSSTLKIESYPDLKLVIKNSDVSSFTAIYDSNWNLQSMHNKDVPLIIDCQLQRTGQMIHASGRIWGEDIDREIKLPDPNIPWIQDPTHGFNSFALSSDSEKKFYALHPQDVKLYTFRVIKNGFTDLAGHGRVIKLIVKFTSGLKKFITLATAYHNPVTGQQVQLNYGRAPAMWGEWKIKNQL